MSDLIDRQAAIDALKNRWKKTRNYEGNGDDIAEECELYLKQVPSAQPEPREVVPHRNYQYLSDYWCECGWHLGKKGDVKYCPDCGRKVKWDG